MYRETLTKIDTNQTALSLYIRDALIFFLFFCRDDGMGNPGDPCWNVEISKIKNESG